MKSTLVFIERRSEITFGGSRMAVLSLSGSVGAGGNNSPDDVKKVVDRFVELGYTWVSGITKGNDKELVRTIKLFQSIFKGKGKADSGDGKISHLANTQRWLAAQNAPAWVKVFGGSGVGWKSTVDYRESNGGYATSWLLDRLKLAALAYRAKAALTVSDAPPLWVRECSPAKGGDAIGHKSHETGIDIDLRLPLLPPHTNEWFQLGTHNYSKLFHFEAAWAQCEAFKSWMDPKYVFFNDPRFIKARLSSQEANHSEHYHIRIKPPTRIDGTIS